MATPAARFDLPTPDASTLPFWEAARGHKLLIKLCGTCGRSHFYPRPFCPKCWSTDVDWIEASGAATLYTYSVVHQNDLPPFAGQVPYVAAIVTLDEGPRMMSNVVDCEFGDLRIGMPLVVAFDERADDVTIPVFTPA